MSMRVILSSYTPDPVLAIARAARTCYSNDKFEAINDQLTKAKQKKMIKNIIDSGHGSCLEHAVFTFHVEGISRSCSHQLVRHRIASYEQRSQRYTTQGYDEFVIPPTIKNNKDEKLRYMYTDFMEQSYDVYRELVDKGVPKEDARYVLPNAATTTIVITMNLRALRNFWELRMCTRAQWEIQRLAVEMYWKVEGIDPILVYKAGPKCKTGKCTEKNKTPRCPFRFEDVFTPEEIDEQMAETPTEEEWTDRDDDLEDWKEIEDEDNSLLYGPNVVLLKNYNEFAAGSTVIKTQKEDEDFGKSENLFGVTGQLEKQTGSSNSMLYGKAHLDVGDESESGK